LLLLHDFIGTCPTQAFANLCILRKVLKQYTQFEKFFDLYTFNQVANNESEQTNFTHLFRCQTLKVKPYIILSTSRKHVNYEEDKNKVPWTSFTTSKIRIFALVFSIFHFLKHYLRIDLNFFGSWRNKLKNVVHTV